MGAFLGAAFGLAAALLLWQLAILPPDRLLAAGLPAAGMVAGAWATSFVRPPVRRQFWAVVIGAALLAAVALTGLPEWQRGGGLAGPCVLDIATEGSAPLVPEDTSATSPWQVPRDRTLTYDYAVASAEPVTASATGLTLMGFNTVLMREVIDAGLQPADSGEVNVGELLTELRDTTGYYPYGVHHVFVTVDAGDAPCELQAYVAIPPTHPFDGPVLLTLWVLAIATVAAMVTLALRLRRRRPRSPRSPS